MTKYFFDCDFQTIVTIVSVIGEDFRIVVNRPLDAMCSLTFVHSKFATER